MCVCVCVCVCARVCVCVCAKREKVRKKERMFEGMRESDARIFSEKHT